MAGHPDNAPNYPGRDAYWILVWLSKLRWGAVVGQLVTIIGVHALMHIELPLAPLLTIVGLKACSNLALVLWIRREPVVREWLLGAVMAGDVLVLTALLYLTGGPLNPFSALYLVHIALAAAVLRDRWTWTLVLLSLACYGALFVQHSGLDLGAGEAHSADHMRMHLDGMWVAFGVAAGFIAYFVSRVRRALASKDKDLARAREQAASAERLASLTTLAAGAAHELSSPLATIAVAATELEFALAESLRRDPELLADLQLIRHEVDRCRAILDQMAADAGETKGERIASAPVRELFESAQRDLMEQPIAIDGDPEALERRVEVPRRAAEQAIRAILKNAIEASGGAELVSAEVRTSADFVELRIVDGGPGMSESTLARVGEPFFTTKETGRGMGLGVFLAKTVLTGLGGGLRLEAAPGRGTTATLTIPVACGNLPPSASSGRL